MAYTYEQVSDAAARLQKNFAELENKHQILRDPLLRGLYELISTLPQEERGKFGKEVNDLKAEVQGWLDTVAQSTEDTRAPIDVTAPWDVNTPHDKLPALLPTELGTEHVIMTEFNRIADIFNRMGFATVESRQLDDDYHMFGSLNFPDNHPARDDYDTFMTTEGLVAPAHTSTMQNRVMQQYRGNLDSGEPIAVLIPGRVFRNEDLDATHEHTFYQFEGVFVGEDITVGNLIATLQTFMSAYFGEELKAKIQPFYFPFTEPSFEFAVERPAILRRNNTEAEQWMELGGCGMIHPNVLKDAGIDPVKYTGFAWGWGIERLIMMKYGIEDIRHFESGKLEFLRQFK